jgi:ubiquinone/menaquinone biosynthesis C-methylase UbiE
VSPAPINSHYDDDPATYAALRASWMSGRRVALVSEFLTDARPGDTVLELGAGTGDLLLDIAAARPDLQFVGVEPLGSYVTYARERAKSEGVANVRFVEGFAEEPITLDGARADWVVSIDVLHHVRSMREAADNVAAATKPGAKWFILEPSWLNPYMFAFCVLTKGERNFFPRRFLRGAEQAGWRQQSRRFGLLIPSRVKEPKAWMKRAEQRFERVPGLAGAVVLQLQRS